MVLMFISFAGANYFLLFFGFNPVFTGHLSRESAFPIRSVQHKSVAGTDDQKYSIFSQYFANSLKFKTPGTD